MKKLMGEYGEYFGFSVSHTTRQPRPGEEDGKDYHFVTKEQMQELISAGEFIENAPARPLWRMFLPGGRSVSWILMCRV